MYGLLLFAALLAPSASPAGSLAIGEKLRPFALKQASGQPFDLASLGARKAYVLAFIATRCPASNDYNARMASFAKEYAPRGVAFVGIDTKSDEAPAGAAEPPTQNGLGFPVLEDAGNSRADALGAQVAPEVFVFDAGWTLRYRGRIDDDRAGSAVPAADLEAAVDALLAGREVKLKETKAFGCSIRHVSRMDDR